MPCPRPCKGPLDGPSGHISGPLQPPCTPLADVSRNSSLYSLWIDKARGSHHYGNLVFVGAAPSRSQPGEINVTESFLDSSLCALIGLRNLFDFLRFRTGTGRPGLIDAGGRADRDRSSTRAASSSHTSRQPCDRGDDCPGPSALLRCEAFSRRLNRLRVMPPAGRGLRGSRSVFERSRRPEGWPAGTDRDQYGVLLDSVLGWPFTKSRGSGRRTGSGPG